MERALFARSFSTVSFLATFALSRYATSRPTLLTLFRRFSPSTRLSPAEGRRAERRRVEGVGNDGGKVTSLATRSLSSPYHLTFSPFTSFTPFREEEVRRERTTGASE